MMGKDKEERKGMYKKKIGARAFTAVTVASLLASNVTPAMAAEDANAMAKAAKKVKMCRRDNICQMMQVMVKSLR